MWWCNGCLCLAALPIKHIPAALLGKLSSFRAPFVSRGLTDDLFVFVLLFSVLFGFVFLDGGVHSSSLFGVSEDPFVRSA